MRVICGKYKGVQLSSPRGEVRPTTDLVKGSLFSVLDSKGMLNGAECLDLFAGSGSLGIEALSRGAHSCVFVDIDTSNVKRNLDKIKLTEKIIRADFRRALRLLKDRTFDLVFCDPPYKTDYAQDAYMLINKLGLLKHGGLIVIEHASDSELKNISDNCIIDHRIFGASAFDLVRGGSESDFCGNV